MSCVLKGCRTFRVCWFLYSTFNTEVRSFVCLNIYSRTSIIFSVLLTKSGLDNSVSECQLCDVMSQEVTYSVDKRFLIHLIRSWAVISNVRILVGLQFPIRYEKWNDSKYFPTPVFFPLSFLSVVVSFCLWSSPARLPGLTTFHIYFHKWVSVPIPSLGYYKIMTQSKWSSV